MSKIQYFDIRKKYARCFLILATFSFSFYFVYKTSFVDRSNSVNRLKLCIRNASKIYYNNSNTFFAELSVCIKIHLDIDETKINDFSNNIGDEKKMFIPLFDNKAECKWLTIGIGGTENAEKSFKQKNGQCKIYGIEPNDAGNFSSIGTVVPYGIGLDDTISDVVIGKPEGWILEKSKVISLLTLHDKFIHSRFVEFLTIDIEGYEYIILEALVGNGKFANEGITFCQIDAELHNIQMATIHSAAKNLNPVQFMLNFVQDSSPYIPIFTMPYTYHPHQKVTFINIKDKRCEKIFKFSHFY